jgi:hypothetical protein
MPTTNFIRLRSTADLSSISAQPVNIGRNRESRFVGESRIHKINNIGGIAINLVFSPVL